MDLYAVQSIHLLHSLRWEILEVNGCQHSMSQHHFIAFCFFVEKELFLTGFLNSAHRTESLSVLQYIVWLISVQEIYACATYYNCVHRQG